jgi:hypothetical protein
VEILAADFEARHKHHITAEDAGEVLMSTLFPLHGAILVTNPRKESNHMALALENPSHTTQRRVARFAAKKGISLEQAWAAAGFKKGAPIEKRGPRFASPEFKKFFFIGAPKGSMKAKIRSGKFGGAGTRGGSVTPGQIKAAGDVYSDLFEANLGRAARIKAGTSRGIKYRTVGGRQHRVQIDPQISLLEKRITNKLFKGLQSKGRKRSESPHYAAWVDAKGHKSKLMGLAKKLGISVAADLRSQAKDFGKRGKLRDAAISRDSARNLKPRAAGKAAKGRGRGAKYTDAVSLGKIRGGAGRHQQRIALANGLALTNGLALENGYGALALENGLALENSVVALPIWARDNVMGAVQGAVTAYIPSVLIGAAVGGVAHAVAVPWVMKGCEAVGCPEFITSRPYLTTGTVALIGGAAAGSALLRSENRIARQAGAAVAVAGCSAFAVGAVFDLAPWFIEKTQEYLPSFLKPGDDDISEPAMSGLALSGLGMEDLAGLALGDGGLWETAPLNAEYSDLFSQADLGDALHCGADFSGAEGESFLAGPSAYVARFGRPAHRVNAKPTDCSHLAGQPGHRWGWLVKMVGWPTASRIAALPPKNRLAVLKRMRAAAVQAARQQAALDQQTEFSNQQVLANGEGLQGVGTHSAPTGATGAVQSDIFADSPLAGALVL